MYEYVRYSIFTLLRSFRHLDSVSNLEVWLQLNSSCLKLHWVFFWMEILSPENIPPPEDLGLLYKQRPLPVSTNKKGGCGKISGKKLFSRLFFYQRSPCFFLFWIYQINLLSSISYIGLLTFWLFCLPKRWLAILASFFGFFSDCELFWLFWLPQRLLAFLFFFVSLWDCLVNIFHLLTSSLISSFSVRLTFPKIVNFFVWLCWLPLRFC